MSITTTLFGAFANSPFGRSATALVGIARMTISPAWAASATETGVAPISVAGDHFDAKAAVLRLVDDLGFDPVDGGDLDNSWRQQPGTPAYCRDLEAAVLRRALAEADRSRIAEYRAEQEARIRGNIAG